MFHWTTILHKKKKSWYYIYMLKHGIPKENRLLVKVCCNTTEVTGSRPEKKKSRFFKNFQIFVQRIINMYSIVIYTIIKKKSSSRSSASARLVSMRMSVEDRERIESDLQQIQERKNLKEMENLKQMQKKRDDDKWDINHMSEFDFVRCDYSE